MSEKRNPVTMPRIFTPAERDRIEKKLLETAAVCLASYGVRRTTVDEITAGAHIAKGSFYLFYDSKEDLFLSLFDSFVLSLEDDYLGMLQELDENHIVTSLTAIFSHIASRFRDEGIFRFLDSENRELIERKVSQKRYEAVKKDMEKSFYSLFSYFSIDDESDIRSFMDAYRAILSLFLHGEKKETVDFLIRGLVLQLVQ
jgi:AcrR family transcriptional regulator